MQNLSERIKQLRKNKGLTQNQLAEKLGVTDKAVSKWEVGEANPDISLLVEISKLFDVTIDYLLTGKIEENISLDDMDAGKRAQYLIKKDDAKNFAKYGYPDIVDVFVEPFERPNAQVSEMLEAIYENDSVRIFSQCVKKSLSKHKTSGYQNIFLNVRGDLDSFIKLCCKAGIVDGLKAIGMKYFAIGPKTDTKKQVSFAIRPGDGPADDGYHTYTLGEGVLEYIFSIPDLSKDVLEYLTDIEFFKDTSNTVCFMTDSVIQQLYKTKRFGLLDSLLDKMKKYNQYAAETYSQYGSWFTGKRISGNALYFMNSSKGDTFYLQAYVYPIEKAFVLAIEKNDFCWIEKFNNYNRELIGLLPEIRARTLSDLEINVMRMKADKKTPVEKILETKHVIHGLIDLRALFADDYGIDSSDGVERIKSFLGRANVIKPIIENSFVSPYEMIMTFVKNKKGKELFELAADLQCAELENAVIDGDDDAIENIARKLFLPTKEWMVSLGTELRRARAVPIRQWVEDKEEEAMRVQRAINQRAWDAQCKVASMMIERYIRSCYCANKDLYKQLLDLQFRNVPLDEAYSDPSVELFRDAKKKALEEHIQRLEDSLENLTRQKAMEADYTRISAELKKNYLLSELKKGEADKVVVLICKRLQIILEYKYGYSGDLFTMIDTLIRKTMKLHNCSDDEDNSYYAYQEEDRLFKERTALLHKLRMKRNNIVHVEHKQVDMSTEEIKECIDLLDALSE